MTRPIADLGNLVLELVEGLEQGRLTPGYSRPVHRGSAAGQVAVVRNPRDPEVHLLVITLDVMRSPEDSGEVFFRRLLELNGLLLGRASFWVAEDGRVRLIAGRPMEDLDPSELIDLVLWTTEQADHFDDLLLEEFGLEYRI